ASKGSSSSSPSRPPGLLKNNPNFPETRAAQKLAVVRDHAATKRKDREAKGEAVRTTYALDEDRLVLDYATERYNKLREDRLLAEDGISLRRKYKYPNTFADLYRAPTNGKGVKIINPEQAGSISGPFYQQLVDCGHPVASITTKIRQRTEEIIVQRRAASNNVSQSTLDKAAVLAPYSPDEEAADSDVDEGEGEGEGVGEGTSSAADASGSTTSAPSPYKPAGLVKDRSDHKSYRNAQLRTAERNRRAAKQQAKINEGAAVPVTFTSEDRDLIRPYAAERCRQLQELNYLAPDKIGPKVYKYPSDFADLYRAPARLKKGQAVDMSKAGTLARPIYEALMAKGHSTRAIGDQITHQTNEIIKECRAQLAGESTAQPVPAAEPSPFSAKADAADSDKEIDMGAGGAGTEDADAVADESNPYNSE
ncbi:hypothetical protein DMC30DRAFT_61013, partial [Rhodotorula diobovata]